MNDYKGKVISNEKIGLDGRELWVAFESLPEINGGQFAMLKTSDKSQTLRRPLGIAQVRGCMVSFIYQIKGEGTKTLAKLTCGDDIEVLMPLGNGFYIYDAKKVAIVGGGYGVVPLLSTAQGIDVEKHIFLGFATKGAVMKEKEFAALGNLTVCTDDGSYGYKGYPVTVLEEKLSEIKPDIILCCGPTPLMKAVKALGEKNGIETMLSLEQRMGCGLGACLVCTCKVNGHNARVCADGPVFESTEVYE